MHKSQPDYECAKKDNLQIRMERGIPYREFANRQKFKNVNENAINDVEECVIDGSLHSQRLNSALFTPYPLLAQYFKANIFHMQDIIRIEIYITISTDYSYRMSWPEKS